MEIEEPDEYTCYLKGRHHNRVSDDKRLKDSGRAAVQVTLETEESRGVWEDPDAFRYYQVIRFFKSLEGFYKGTLDLTGRHQHRLDDLLSTFSEFSVDFNAIRATAKIEEYRDRDGTGKVTGKTTIQFVITDAELWKSCRLKWKLPRVVSFTQLERHIAQLAKVVHDAGGKAKLQKLCLTDMPQEVLDLIFSVAELGQTRLLASTCKLLKNVGTPHLYHTRSLDLHLAKHEHILRMISKPPTPKFLNALASAQARRLIHLVNFLISRPGLAKAVENLDMTDHWKMDGRRVPAIRPYWDHLAFYTPVNRSLNTFLASSTGLACLSVSHFAVSSDWLRTISQLPKLHTVRFHCASINDESVEEDILSDRIPPSPQVLSLQWYEPRYHEEEGADEDEPPSRESGALGLWHTLLLFPNLITFNHHLPRADGSLCTQAVTDRCNMFAEGLRRLSIDVVWVFVDGVSRWINEAALRSMKPCTLTHLKLRTDRPISDATIIRLLEAVQQAPLEVLAIEGLKEGSLGLFERIPTLFPDLIGLTLIRRENRFQRNTKLATWPHQSGEYATRFQGFKKLKYFGWNYRISLEESTPCGLVGFEASALEASEKSTKRKGKKKGRRHDHDNDDDHDSDYDWSWLHGLHDDDYFSDAPNLALPFASYCPTLETMCLEDRSREYFMVTRGEHGEVTVKRHSYDETRLTTERDWNPTGYHDGWRPVLPEST
ncbi:hypothetical protein AAF712_002635 [Marasmius tenuissimus]|uniref:F-box domain-containing protein n=1 Tax=Marasmius tenuissimus TaxID=585030 RepID=A0ABR3A9D1_9AGAR